jgi:hypothetical protein
MQAPLLLPFGQYLCRNVLLGRAVVVQFPAGCGLRFACGYSHIALQAKPQNNLFGKKITPQKKN